MSNVSDPFSILNKGQVKAMDPVLKPKRYWPGKQNQILEDEESDSDDIFQDLKPEKKQKIEQKQQQEDEEQEEEQQDQPDKEVLARRRRRIIQSTVVENNNNNEEENNLEQTKIKSVKTEVAEQMQEEQQQKEVVVDQENVEEVDMGARRRQRLRRQQEQEQEEEEQGFEDFQQENNENLKNQLNENEEQNEKITKILQVPSKETQTITKKFGFGDEEENDNQNQDDSDVEDSDEEEDDYYDEESDQNQNIQKILKPVFLKKEERQQRDKELEEKLLLAQEKKKNLERKLQETTNLVQQAIQQDQKVENELANDSDGQQVMPDDDDDYDQAQQMDLWKVRELKRIKKYREDRAKWEKEQREIERRRNLTDEQRMKENIEKGSSSNKEDKTKYVFMQKYYHKGAFYQEEDEDPNSILNRDFNVAVGEELFDKSNAPQILQKRRGLFGKKGQSKYTHLTDQDTTCFDPAFKPDENLQSRMLGKGAGMWGTKIVDRNQFKHKI